MKLTNFWWKALIRFSSWVRVKRWKEINVNCIYRSISEWVKKYFSLICVISPQKNLFLSHSVVKKIFSQFFSSLFKKKFHKRGLKTKHSNNFNFIEFVCLDFVFSSESFQNLYENKLCCIVASVCLLWNENFEQLS